ncbi:glycosyltransferase [Rubritalea marina]|uniref:glycosyltransferase n=1 Tax=Rubritalea marina TaxID=361055 RepID=UPI000360A481|nr:glycosyltransferase [Rubritalea marina]
MRIAIDVRREPNSGVGRVAETLAKRLAPRLAGEHQVELLVSKETEARSSNPKLTVLHEMSHSREGSTRLSHFFHENQIDLFINPNTSWIPKGNTPTINMVHDSWMLLNPHWMPSLDEFSERFKVRSKDIKGAIEQMFQSIHIDRVFTEFGADLYHSSESQSHQVALMQYALIMRFSAGIVCVSDAVQRDILSIYQPPQSITTIHNMVEHYAPSTDREPRMFLCLSKLEKRKNLDLLLDGYAVYCQLADQALPLVIAGTQGYASYRQKILTKIAEMTRAGLDVNYIGPVESQHIPGVFGKSCAVVVTSAAEGFGLPALEAMMAEVPVLSTPVGLIEPYSDHHISLDSHCPSALGASMLGVQQSQPSQASLKQAKRQLADGFSAEAICQQWLDYINRFPAAAW